MWQQKLLRWWYVLRYHRSGQLSMRALKLGRLAAGRMRFRTGIGRVTPSAIVQRLRPDFDPPRLLHADLATLRNQRSAENAATILQGRYCFLNQERALGEPIDWRSLNSPDASRLWRFSLHYHEFLRDLAAEGLATGDATWFDRAWSIVTQWISANPLGDVRVLRDAWHPYCISRRLPVWMSLWRAALPESKACPLVLESMTMQARFLRRNLEWDIGGNHLLDNAKALILVGAFFDGPEADRWLKKGASILRRELAEQILPHGEHFERSPMYHAQMLEAVSDVRDAVRAVLPDLSGLCEATALEMASFLKAFLHPDGEIPLLSDSCFAEAPPAGHLITRAVGKGSNQGPGDRAASRASGQAPLARIVGDYWIYRQGQDFLLFDAGPVGPDHLPAHAHADLLSFEASVRGRRLFIDSGVFDYEEGPMRRYCRSTAAHNVLEVDGQDQCDMWSRFRMGYRGWPRGFASGEQEGFRWARAEHNAYRRLRVPRVGRWLACRPGGPWFCVDWADGAGTHELTSWLHLHPEVRATKTADRQLELDHNGIRLSLRFLAPGELSLATGWYCPEFGLRIPAPVVRWTATVPLPFVCGWSLSWSDCRGVASLEGGFHDGSTLAWDEGTRGARLRPLAK